jgi:hypothetical protein
MKFGLGPRQGRLETPKTEELGPLMQQAVDLRGMAAA